MNTNAHDNSGRLMNTHYLLTGAQNYLNLNEFSILYINFIGVQNLD